MLFVFLKDVSNKKTIAVIGGDCRKLLFELNEELM